MSKVKRRHPVSEGLGAPRQQFIEHTLKEATAIIDQSADRESILLEAQRLIFGDRRQEYGHPLDDYTRTAGMVNSCFAHILKRPFTAEELMMVMVLVKMSRYQETAKRDTLVDMAGYCGTIGEAQAERKRRAGKAQGHIKGSE